MAQEIGTTYDTVVPLEATWFLENRIVDGDLTLLVGDSGIGKDHFILDLAARVTRGDEMPDGMRSGTAGSVILITPEDQPSFTVVHRLKAAGADLSKVIDLTYVGREPFMVWQDHLAVLRQVIARQGDVRMVVINPLAAVSPVSLTSTRIRQVLVQPLQRLAYDTGVAVVGVHHPVKSVTMDSLKNGVGGSKDLTNAVRCGVFIVADPVNPDQRVVVNFKANLAGEASHIRFVIEGEKPETRVRYLDAQDAQDAPEDDDEEAPGWPREGTQPHRVLDALRALADEHDAKGQELPVSGQEVASRTRLEYHTALTNLRRLVNRGLVVSPWRGAYAPVMTAQGKHAPEVVNLLTSV